MHLCFPSVIEMEIGGYCLTGHQSTGLEWVHRWANLQRSSGWLKIAVRLMVLEINWMAGIPVAVCPGCLSVCLGSQAVICQSHREWDSCSIQVPNLSSSAKGVAAPSVKHQVPFIYNWENILSRRDGRIWQELRGRRERKPHVDTGYSSQNKLAKTKYYAH